MPRWDVNFNMRLDLQNPELVSCVAKIDALASVIRDIPIPPRTKESLDALNILRAVRGTTGIEGTELTEAEVRQIMESPPNKPVLPPNRRREEQEARNAEELMYYIVREINRNRNLPLTENLVCKIHEIITKDINYPNNIPGKYRTYPVRAGNYVPPETGEEVRRLMKDFIQWFNEGAPAHSDASIRAIVGHFYAVSIHPFGEGNGRTARGVESFLLYQGGVNARGFYSLANYYYRNRDEYIRLLDHVRFDTNGDLTPFVLFGLRGLQEELKIVHNEVLSNVKLYAYRDYVREQLGIYNKLGTKAGERMLNFLLTLSSEPVSIKNLRRGTHELSFLYRDFTSKTLLRDLKFFIMHKLVVVENDELRANLDIMTHFTPPLELAEKPQHQRKRPRE